MNTDMAEYIMMILKSRLIMWSWGCCRFTAIQNGLIFHVQGYILQNGWVKVLYNEGTDAFDVYFLSNKKELIKKVEEVYLDNLVDVIDYNVEKDGSFDYDQRVKQQYSIIMV